MDILVLLSLVLTNNCSLMQLVLGFELALNIVAGTNLTNISMTS